jgi:hypothetical protein
MSICIYLIVKKPVIMELELIRTYLPDGTNSEILYQAMHLVYTIELPWKDNQTGVSCIPEGRYGLTKRFSTHFGWLLMVQDVPSRSDILIHPANDALKELRGCIAPVITLTGPGTGLESREACSVLNALAFSALDRKEPVFLTIKFH